MSVSFACYSEQKLSPCGKVCFVPLNHVMIQCVCVWGGYDDSREKKILLAPTILYTVNACAP